MAEPGSALKSKNVGMAMELLRFVVCPASEHLHDAIATPSYLSSKKQVPTAVCPCMTRIYFPPRWDPSSMGLTPEFVMDQKNGLSLIQANPYERFPRDRGVEPEREERFAICPASGFLHPPTATLLQRKGKKKIVFTSVCSCMTRVFFGPRFSEFMGFSAEEVKERGFGLSG